MLNWTTYNSDHGTEEEKLQSCSELIILPNVEKCMMQASRILSISILVYS